MVLGNPGKRRFKRAEPVPFAACPEPPDHLSEEAKQEWHRVSQELYKLGLLSNIDRASLAAYCQSYSRWVQAERAIAVMAERDLLTRGLMIRTQKGNAIQNPLIGTANVAMAAMIRYASEFGMTPSARTRLSADGTMPDLDDPAEKYFSKVDQHRATTVGRR
jgi:P27 family predicted phage terminase small subunit